MKKIMAILLLSMFTLNVLANPVFGIKNQLEMPMLKEDHHINNSVQPLTDFKDSFVDWIEVNKIFPLDVASNYNFGKSVSIDNEYIVIGSPWHDYNAPYSGLVYVYKYINSNYIHYATLSGFDAEEWDNFGFSVSISDDVIVVGAPWNKQNEISTGAAYIFTLVGDDWVQQTKLVAFDGEEEDYFGSSVEIFGDYIVIGAPWHNHNDVYSGAAYVYKRDGSDWTFQTKLVASDAQAYDLFGSSVSINGDYIVIGARGSQGSAYIFTLQGSTWVEQEKLIDEQGQSGDNFGCSVSIDNEFVVIGAKGVNNARGSAYIYKLTDLTWEKHIQLNISDGVAGDTFGFSVDIFGEYILIGAPGCYSDRGSAYIFRWYGSTWELENIVGGSDTASDDMFGSSVCIKNDIAVIGAPFHLIDETQTGSCYIFQRKDTIQQVMIFGRIKNLTDYQDFITFQAVATNVMTFFPFSFSRYCSEEIFIISKDYNYIYFGLFGMRYLCAWARIIS
jgi:hypothetical protein